MRLGAPAVIAADAALEESAAHDGFVVVAGQLIEVAGIFQLVGRIGQSRKGHAAITAKADARNAAGYLCAVHAGAVAALLGIDGAVLREIFPDIVMPCAHFAACGAVGHGLTGAKTQIRNLGQLPAQREEQTELRQFGALALPRYGDVAAACTIHGKRNGQQLPVRQGVVSVDDNLFSPAFGGQVIAPGVQARRFPEGKLERLRTALVVVGGGAPEVGADGIVQQLHAVAAKSIFTSCGVGTVKRASV